MVFLTTTSNFNFKVLGQCIHYAHPHSVEATRNLIRTLIEFSTRMERSHGKLDTWHLFGGMDIHRNPPAIVLNCDRIPFVNYHFYVCAVSGHGFINGIIHHLINEVMKTS